MVVQAREVPAPLRCIGAEVGALGLACLQNIGPSARVPRLLEPDQLLPLRWRQKCPNP